MVSWVSGRQTLSQFTINLIWDTSVLQQDNAAQIEASVTAAAQSFASNFSNPVTLNLHVGWGEVNGSALSSTAIAESDPVIIYHSYSQVQTALPGLPVTDPAPSGTVALTTIQAAAIGLPGPTTVEGYVGFNSAANEFVFAQSSPSNNQPYYLGPVFSHEVSEVMGRIAELGQDSRGAYSVMDFYRYSDTGARNLTQTGSANFSTNGGATLQTAFNTKLKGDLGDWGGTGDAFDAFAVQGEAASLSAADLSLMSVLGWTPTGTLWDSAIVNTMTEEWLGRAASYADISTYQTSFATGGTLQNYRQTLLGYTEGQAHTTAEIQSLYDTYFGRDPTASEYSVWRSLIVGGADFGTLRSTLIGSPEGQSHTTTEIETLYDTYFGRDPTASEYAVWQGLIAGGADFNGLRATLVGSPDGQTHTNLEIKSLYDTYFGRDPSGSEYTVWQGLVTGGTDFNSLRATLVGSSEGASHTTAEIKSLYDTYFGRDPSASEYSVWQGLVAGGTDFNGLRGTLVGSPEGQAHTAAEIKSLYDTYFGRDPSASEYTVWQGLVANGTDFGALRGTLLGSAEGQSHTTPEIKLLYDTYFGRDPAASEYSVWQGLIAGGTDFHQLQDTLERQSTASSVQHLVATGAAQTFALGAAPNLTVDSFNAQLDTITLSSAQYGGINPLDAAHAQQISAYDGTDVLITLDASHSILLEHTQLSALHAGDFLFG